MKNLGFFNKEINMSVRDKDYARLNSAWAELDQHIMELYSLRNTAIEANNQTVIDKYTSELAKCWELNSKCFDFLLDEAVEGRYNTDHN